MTAFAIIAVVFTFVAVGVVVWPLLRAGERPHSVVATLIALTIPAVVLVVYLLVSNYNWSGATGAIQASSAGPSGMDQAVASLEAKLAESPNDEEGWILLGSSYLSLNRAADAAVAYKRALDISDGRNVAARLGLAESRIVVDPGTLTGPVGDEIEAVLAQEPRNPKALWYGGLLSLARGDTATAATRWRMLLGMSPPDRVREIIETQLAELDRDSASSAAGSGGTQPAKATVPGSAPIGVAGESEFAVEVSVDDAVRGQISSAAPLFVFVRDAGAAGPPLAVIRRQASELPLSIRISDADIMLPGRSLAKVQSAILVARVANGGDPIARPGDVYGEARWERGSGADNGVRIVIDKVVAP
ncbi:MAG: hypothetical protein R3F24_13330 [Gammaproteobacteria bacterium]